MIYIFEPLCKSISHEKFNAGFILLARKSYPNEPIYFFSEAEHISCVKNILKDEIPIRNIYYTKVNWKISNSILRFPMIFFQLLKVMLTLKIQKKDKILFTSFNPLVLVVMKIIGGVLKLRSLNFVLHGSFESISDGYFDNLKEKIEIQTIPKKSIKEIYKSVSIPAFLKKIFGKLTFVLREKTVGKIDQYFSSILKDKTAIEWKSNSNLKYIALSPHILESCWKFLDQRTSNIYPIYLPTPLKKLNFISPGSFPKFAIFGFGNSIGLLNLLIKLEEYKIQKPYLINIIGMDNRGTERFENVICKKPGSVWTRDEMESEIQDMDFVLILYDKSKYNLSCSGSILESLSYSKPIIFLDNSCINHFYNISGPIGVKCKNLDDFAEKTRNLIENWELEKNKIPDYHLNISKVRDVVSIDQNVSDFKKVFE